jgi:hypothetical protein
VGIILARWFSTGWTVPFVNCVLLCRRSGCGSTKPLVIGLLPRVAKHCSRPPGAAPGRPCECVEGT